MTENRETFFNRLIPFLAPSHILDCQLAYTLAKFSHRAQTRKELGPDGQPLRYFEHVRRVALVLLDDVKIVDRDMIIAALLHDGIEDTVDVTAEMLDHVFGSHVAQMVKTLSKCPKEGYLERFFMCRDWQTYILKGCDRLDNLRSSRREGVTPEHCVKTVKETKEKYFPLFDRMVELTPLEYKSNANTLRDLLRAETARLET